MVRGILSVVHKEIRGMHEAAYLLAGFALLSQLLALFRDRLFASAFGIGETLDVYYAAFRIPDLLFTTVASLFSLYAILPILSGRVGTEARTIEKIVLWFFGLTGVAALIAYILAPTLIPYLMPGFSAHAQGELLLLTRILLLQPILLGASNVLASLTQLRSRFVLYAVSPLLYNIGIIIGITLLYPMFGLMGLGYGVVLGALMHLLIQIPYFLSERRGEKEAEPAPIGAILTLSAPRTLALAAGQITLVILTAIASGLTPGSLSAFSLSMNLQAVPLAVIGMSYSVAAFPTLARLLGKGDRALFISHMETALRHIAFWSIPALVLIVVLRAQIVRVVLGSGAFDWDATRLTAAALAILVLSFVCQSVTYLLSRGYYAAGKTARPLFLAALSVVVSVISAFVLLSLFKTHPTFAYFMESLFRVENVPGTEMLMLALAFSLGTVVQMVGGLILFTRDFALPVMAVGVTAVRGFAASVLGGFFAYVMLVIVGALVDINTFVGIFAQGLAGGLTGVIATVGILHLLGSPELRETADALRRRLRDRTPAALEPSEIAS